MRKLQAIPLEGYVRRLSQQAGKEPVVFSTSVVVPNSRDLIIDRHRDSVPILDQIGYDSGVTSNPRPIITLLGARADAATRL